MIPQNYVWANQRASFRHEITSPVMGKKGKSDPDNLESGSAENAHTLSEDAIPRIVLV